MRVLMAATGIFLLSGCGPKNTAPAAPIVGWHTEEGWAFSCYYPPDYDSLSETDRRLARSDVLIAIETQWSGERNDGISFDEDTILNIDTVLLGRPDRIESVSRENLTYCKQAASGAQSATPWRSWINGLAANLTEGECNKPFDYTMFDYLDIQHGWQREMPICEGDRIRITGTEGDQYRITDRGSYMNVGGDLSQPTVGGDWPCNIEGCYAGQLVMKFVADNGIETIMPVGTELVFRATAHGKISYRINDETFYDNTWRQRGSLIDHTAIEISPAQ